MSSPVGFDITKREVDDFYKTPPHVTEALLSVETFGPRVWEPACGDGAISEVFKARGHDVMSSDLKDRGYGASGEDFLTFPAITGAEVCRDIVTNPPFKLAAEFVLHSLRLGAPKVAMLLRLAWLEGEARRREVFAPHPPSRVWVLSGRPTLWNGSDPNPRDTGGAMAYAWFVWDKAAAPGTALGWLPARVTKRGEASAPREEWSPLLPF